MSTYNCVLANSEYRYEFLIRQYFYNKNMNDLCEVCECVSVCFSSSSTGVDVCV